MVISKIKFYVRLRALKITATRVKEDRRVAILRIITITIDVSGLTCTRSVGTRNLLVLKPKHSAVLLYACTRVRFERAKTRMLIKS